MPPCPAEGEEGSETEAKETPNVTNNIYVNDEKSIKGIDGGDLDENSESDDGGDLDG